MLEEEALSYRGTNAEAEGITENILIEGDNLLALKALESEFTGKVKCVFIDPPYNTGSAFAQYDDGVEHSLWLSLIRHRLELLRKLLASDGSLWVTLDDNEAHYFKVMCDEVFGRHNFVANVVWAKRVSPANDARYFSSDHDYILVYAKDKTAWNLNRLPRGEQQNAFYKNPDNDPRGPWNSVTYTGNKNKQQRPNLWYPINNPNTGRPVLPPDGLTWRYGPETHANNEAKNLLYWGKDGKSRTPRMKMFLSAAEDIVPRSIWPASEVGSTQTAMTEQKALNPIPFATPKPEALLERILTISTKPGDLVLDSFAGSGTTGAVAHKMGRRWIMVELGEHARSHIVPRMCRIVDGKDSLGVTESTQWEGGGGFRFYYLAPTLMEYDKWGREVISGQYDGQMLARALCKLEGFRYNPSETDYWNHGYSSERDFIFVSTQTLTYDQLRDLSEQVGDERTLLVLCAAYRGNPNSLSNLTVKKIPDHVRDRCEWKSEGYEFKNVSRNSSNLSVQELAAQGVDLDGGDET